MGAWAHQDLSGDQASQGSRRVEGDGPWDWGECFRFLRRVGVGGSVGSKMSLVVYWFGAYFLYSFDKGLGGWRASTLALGRETGNPIMTFEQRSSFSLPLRGHPPTRFKERCRECFLQRSLNMFPAAFLKPLTSKPMLVA